MRLKILILDLLTNGSNLPHRSGQSGSNNKPTGEQPINQMDEFLEENIYKKKRDRTNNCHVERRFISDCHKYHKDTSYLATKSQTLSYDIPRNS